MKKILFSLAFLLLPLALPCARAYHDDDQNDYHAAAKILHSIEYRYSLIQLNRERYGSSRHIREEMAELAEGIRVVRWELEGRRVSGRRLRAECVPLNDLLAHLADEYRARRSERSYEEPPPRHHYFGW